MQQEELGEALAFPGAGVEHRRIPGERPGDHSEDRERARVAVDDGLEDQRGEGCVGVGGHHLVLRASDRGAIGGGGQELRDGVLQGRDAHFRGRGAAEHGQQGSAARRLDQTRQDLLLREGALFEVLLEEHIVGLGDVLHQ